MPTRKIKNLAQQGLSASQQAIENHRYSKPVFILSSALSGFSRHNGFNLSASLAFYALFALIPLALLSFFLLSHLVVSSHLAVDKLNALLLNLMPKYNRRIMIEVFNIAKHQAAWGFFGIFALLWASTPLASALRSALFTIAQIPEPPSYLRRTLEDILAVLGILILLFLFTFSGMMLEKPLATFNSLPWIAKFIRYFTSIGFTGIFIALFVQVFSPGIARWSHAFMGALVTALLWSAMQPAFSLFLMTNQSYSTLFGGMKNLFLSISWLYYAFMAFLLGVEIIIALKKSEMLMLRGLFTEKPEDIDAFHKHLMQHFGRTYRKNEFIYKMGESDNSLYYVISGEIAIESSEQSHAIVTSNNYFGETGFLVNAPRQNNAKVVSDIAKVLVIHPEQMHSLISEDPSVASQLLKDMAQRLETRPG